MEPAGKTNAPTGKTLNIAMGVKGGKMGAKVPIMKGQLLEKEQIDQLVERFTQTYNYKSYAEMDREFNCHQIEDSIKTSNVAVLEQVRRQQQQYKEKALAQREQLLTELRLFRGAISKLIRDDVPKLVHLYKQQQQKQPMGPAAAPPNASTSAATQPSPKPEGN